MIKIDRSLAKKKNSITSMILVFLLILASLSPILTAYHIKNADLKVKDEQTNGPIEIRKYVLIDGEEHKIYQTENNSILRFRVKIKYHDTDGEGENFLLKDIVIKDKLPDEMKYLDNASIPADSITNDDKTIEWNFTNKLVLTEKEDEYPDNITIDFDVKVEKEGILKNTAEVTGLELCKGIERYNETSINITVGSIEKYHLNVETIGKGKVIKTPEKNKYLQNEEVILKAIPEENWKFYYWNGELSGNESIKSIIMDKNKTISAHFRKNNTGEKLKINITKPKKQFSYFYNIPIGLKIQQTKIVGPITIKTKVENESEIEKVEFYIDGKLKNTDEKYPYEWTWWFKPIDLIDLYEIKVVAYDKHGNNNSDNITVHRERPKILLSGLAKIIINLFGKDLDNNFWNNLEKDKLKKFILIAGGVLIAGSIIRLLRNRGDETEPDETEPDETDPVEPDNKNANEKPVAKISGPYQGEIDQKISFDASDSYDPNGDSMTYKWDFGDGNTAYGEKVTHIYKKPGKYTIKLTLEDTQGLTETEKRTIEITDKDKSKEEDTTFWYIVTGLSTGLLATLGTLYFRRRYFV